MAYAVDVPRQVRREINALPSTVHDRVIQAMNGLRNDPRPSGCTKLKGSVDEYRIRVGDYRVRYMVDDTQRQVRVLRVAHRRDVYRP